MLISGITLAEPKTEPPPYFFPAAAQTTTIMLLLAKQYDDSIFHLLKWVVTTFTVISVIFDMLKNYETDSRFGSSSMIIWDGFSSIPPINFNSFQRRFKVKKWFFQKFNVGASGREEVDERIAKFGEEGESGNEEAAECDNWLCEVLAEHWAE